MDEIPVEQIIRSTRHTIALEVTPRATLVVRAPRRVSAEYIATMIREKSAWILKKMEEVQRRPQAPVRSYAEGDLFWFLGRVYPLRFSDDPTAGIVRTDRLTVPRADAAELRRRIEAWYRQEAGIEINARCMYFSMMTGYSPATLRITGARQRWGSCTSKGGLNFSWRLIQAPLPIVDYVIVHELVHLRQHDHSKKFWATVEVLMPDYEHRLAWLHENEWMLRI